MGSRVITALTEQKGNRSTNPEGKVPELSRPIQQVGALITFPVSTRPIEQKFSAATAENAGNPISNPIIQILRFSFPTITPPEPPNDNDSILEQRRAGTLDVVNDIPYQGPLEQDQSISEAGRLEQLEVVRVDVDGTPIEQIGTIDNTVAVEQFDLIELIFPPCGSIKNPTNTNLLWRIRDFGFSFNTETLIFKIEGIEVQNRSSFTITDLGNGLELFYNPADDFPFDTEIEVFVQISDTADPPNTFFVRCSWRTVPDTRPPIIANVTPCDQSSGVSTVAPVTFDVYDSGLGLDKNSIFLSIEGIPVCDGLSFDPVFFPGSGTGFHVEWEHPEAPFKFGANTTVAIIAGDLANPQNSALFLCDFDTEESAPPTFQNFNPGPCDSFVDTRTGLTFEVYGDLHGVDISTLEVRVDNKLRRVIVAPRILRSQ